MQINKIQNINLNFGAKIWLDSEKAKALVDYSDKQKAGEILDRFEKFHPDEVVRITTVKASNESPYKMILFAENLNTRESEIHPCLKDIDIQKNDSPHNRNELYTFLEYLLNPREFSDFKYFWGNEPVKDHTNADLKQHNVFIKG